MNYNHVFRTVCCDRRRKISNSESGDYNHVFIFQFILESGMKSSSLLYYRRPLYDCLIGDQNIFVADPKIFIGGPNFFYWKHQAWKLGVKTPSLESLMKRSGSPMKSLGSSEKVYGLRWKSGVFNKHLGVSNENLV